MRTCEALRGRREVCVNPKPSYNLKLVQVEDEVMHFCCVGFVLQQTGIENKTIRLIICTINTNTQKQTLKKPIRICGRHIKV